MPHPNPFDGFAPATVANNIARMIELMQGGTRPGDALRVAFGAEPARQLIAGFRYGNGTPPEVSEEVVADVIAVAFAAAFVDGLEAMTEGAPEH